MTVAVGASWTNTALPVRNVTQKENKMSIETVLYFLAAVGFGLDAFRAGGPISWTPAAFCLLTIALFLI